MVARGAQGGRRRAVPYNSYVQHDRQQKYYHRKRTINKYKRFQRYEERQKSGDAGSGAGASTFDASLADADAAVAEFERGLAFSFGESAADGELLRPAKKRRRRAASSGEAADPGDVAADPGDVVRERGRKAAKQGSAARERGGKATKQEGAEAAQDGAAAGAGASGGGRGARLRGSGKKARLGSRAEEAQGVADGAGSEGAAPAEQPAAAKAGPRASQAGNLKGRRKGPGVESLSRFTKEAMEYQRAQEAKEAERQRIQQEIRDRNRKRRDYGKSRALKGQRLAQRNAKGQPRMQSMLQMLTSKLAQQARSAGDSGS